ncbi:hypothetical protein PVK06_018853 [Gossypium arboreum]|uniref:Uncharacterized protein n=1 Tax=Gossypium arboreum TaxID=29729 RepID=A0ABR0PI43_GOSAR|nr:hypothetical protein PVK06_018853 [Gossypium arboreum]
MRPQPDQSVGWCPLAKGWVKLNIGGAAGSNRIAKVGGVLRDSVSSWTKGYNQCVGRCSVQQSEVWMLFEVRLACDCGLISESC